MARLVTCGFEFRALSNVANASEGEGFLAANSPSVETSTVRSGAGAMKCSTSAANCRWGQTGVLDRTYYLRSCIQISGTPTGDVYLMDMQNATPATVGSVRMLSGQTAVGLYDKNGAQVGSNSSALSTGVWYRLELVVKVPTSGNGTLELWIDDVQIAASSSAAVLNVAIGRFRTGQLNAVIPGVNIFVDDVAVNDDQGASQNGRPGAGKIVLLKPTADNQLSVGWTGGSLGVLNLWNAVDNTPPVGVAVGVNSTDTTQIENALNDGAGALTYTADTQTYTAAGIAAGDSVKVVQAVANQGQNTTTSRTLAIGVWANPADQTDALTVGPAAAAGTYPSNWSTGRGPVLYNPSVTFGNAPAVRVRKHAQTTDTVTCDFMGIYVEYRSPTNVALAQGTEADEAQALSPRKQAALAQATETDLAQALTARKEGALGQASETDEAQPLTARKLGALAQAVETDAALSFAVRREVALGQSVETDEALPFAVRKLGHLGIAEETDDALPFTDGSAQRIPLSQALETDEALPFTVVQGPVTPVLPIPQGGWRPLRLPPRKIPLGIAQEFDEALPFSVRKVRRVRSVRVGRATEFDEALPFSIKKRESLEQEDDLVVSGLL